MRYILALGLAGLLVSGCGKSNNPSGPSGPQPDGPQGPQGTQTTTVGGAWRGTAVSSQLPGERFNIAVTLTQSGTTITGTFTCMPVTGANCAAPSATVAGTLNGTDLKAQVLLPGNVVACASFNGTMSSNNAMSGSYTCGTADAGTWSLTRQ
jgi:hypothetical protein